MGSITLCNFDTHHTYRYTHDIARSVFRLHFNLPCAVNMKDEKVYFYCSRKKKRVRLQLKTRVDNFRRISWRGFTYRAEEKEVCICCT
jgi:hypothetical protein